MTTLINIAGLALALAILAVLGRLWAEEDDPPRAVSHRDDFP